MQDMEYPSDGNDLHLRNGYPSVYYQFLHNIMSEKVDDIVFPLPLPGLMGAVFFEMQKASPDSIYIDGCHDEECVFEDISMWFPLLQDRGIIFGDDYQRAGVKNAVKRFCDSKPKCQQMTDLERLGDTGKFPGRTYVLQKI